MIKANVCYALLVKRLREQAVQSVKIVVLAGMVMVVKNVKLVSIERLRWMILRPVSTAELDNTNLTLVKQVAFRVHQESINI